MHHEHLDQHSTSVAIDPAARVVEELQAQGVLPADACARVGVDPAALSGGVMLFADLVALAAVCGRRPAYFFNG